MDGFFTRKLRSPKHFKGLAPDWPRFSSILIAMKTLKLILLSVSLAGLTLGIGCDRDGMDGGPAGERTAGQVIDDTTLTASVKDALGKDAVKFPDVNVSSRSGVVQLSGFVNTGDQKDRAGDIAKDVAGVKKVENNITVKEARTP